ncbi:MliC family protein [Palleronia abyssalis]|uniref:Membrane-bound lysozyme inhibitor of C-type lysozyme n=1 Tax=Palleronia abyssalis TaxID=1501240 RepID=A0A2R8BQE3_9RHOB|nr:MliC family protein [Palleronia abyssalis]SPJ22392.1 Membrane-bound lysozyme inhibitor of C-type lysozyme [Palleronia abyssalis]
MIRLITVATLAIAPAVASAAPEPVTYECERGARVPVLYVNGVDPTLAILLVDGNLVALPRTPAASGSRYVDGEAGYLWYIKGDDARLQWIDAETGDVLSLLNECRAIHQR